MEIKKLAFGLIIVLTTQVIGAQDLPKIVPPPAEAAAFTKFTEIPVSLYNGLPNINIPFYTIPIEQASIPVGLSYHAKGIQVEEIASSVGIGWTLNTGGSITRQIRGSADEFIANGVTGYLRDNFYETFFTSPSTRLAVYNSDLLGEQDMYPDSFHFNFMGYSGKFIFDQRTKLPIIQHFSDLSITPIWENGTYGRILGWDVVTPNGFKLRFGISSDGLRTARDKEVVLDNITFDTALSVTTATGSVDANMAWHLLDIVGPNGKTVTYSYVPENTTYCRRSYDKFDAGTSLVRSYASKVRPQQSYISEILHEKGKIKFIKGIERDDLSGGHSLERIDITDLNDNLIKRFSFTYNYTTANIDGNVLAPIANLDPKATKRLYLSQIDIIDKQTNVAKPPYKFTYDSTALPHRFSNAQDSWGYYNGKNNGQFLTFFDYGTTTVNRQVDTIKSQAGILKKVEFPTGGSMNYEYEHNRGIPPNYFEDLLFENSNPTVSKFAGLVKNPLFYNGTIYESDSLTISTDIVGQVKVDVSISPFSLCPPDQASANCPYKIELLRNQFVMQFNPGSNDITIPAGTYVLRATPKNIGSEDPYDWETSYFSVGLSWKENLQGSSGEEILFTSGHRIRKTVLNDENGSTVTREYEYKDPNGFSSGKVFSLPSYYYRDEVVGGVTVIKRKYGARPGSPLTYEQGNHEGYEYVTEHIVGSNGKQGKTEHRFTVFEDGGSFYTFPYHLATDNEWMRGSPLYTKSYKKEAQGYTLIREVINNYNYDGYINTPYHLMNPISSTDEIYRTDRTGHITSFILFYDPDGTPGGPNAHNEFKTFYLTGGTMHLASTEEIAYDGNFALHNKTFFTYDYSRHYQTKETKHISSSGKETFTKLYYPTDKNDLSGLSINASNALDIMETGQIATKVQREVTTKNAQGTVLSHSVTRTDFKDWGNNVLMPELVKTAKNNGTLENRLEYLDYDDVGNVLEVKQTNGTHVSYIWGYNKTFPVAKVENATRARIAALSQFSQNFHTGAGGLSATQETQLRGLSNAMVTTYTYEPMIGVTSITDPRGNTMEYLYDDSNRLRQVRDYQGHPVEEYIYSYKN